MAALGLKNKEVIIISQTRKTSLQQLQKLLPKTPRSVIFFLGGQLPGEALVHLRQLTLFRMVCHLPNSVIHKMGTYILSTSKLSSTSWFFHIRKLILMYNLPPPLALLQCPPPKKALRSLIRSKVMDYWEVKLRQEAASLKSLSYFKPEFMSLQKTHPLWQTCGSNPFEVDKAVIQARMLSGRYQTDQLARHWSSNTEGICQLPSCTGREVGSLEHILLFCQALQPVRNRMFMIASKVSEESETLYTIIQWVLNQTSKTILMQFLLDCSSLPIVIRAAQHCSDDLLSRLFHVSRNCCYSMHRARMNMLGYFSIDEFSLSLMTNKL